VVRRGWARVLMVLLMTCKGVHGAMGAKETAMESLRYASSVAKSVDKERGEKREKRDREKRIGMSSKP
jgi:hypothetical protein